MFRHIKRQFISGELTSEITEITVEEACELLKIRSYRGRDLECDTDEDATLLLRTYFEINNKDFNTCIYPAKDTEDASCVAYPAETDVFYVDNMFYSFEAGIREFDWRYRKVNTHETIFDFRASNLYRYLCVDNEKDEDKKRNMAYICDSMIAKREQLGHPSYEDAKEYLKYVWSSYEKFFHDDLKPCLEDIVKVNENFNLPWYERLQRRDFAASFEE